MLPIPIRLDVNSLPALIAGGLLLVGAAALGLKQWWAFRRLTQNAKVNEAGYRIAERQIRHRLIVAGMMFVLWVAIPLGDQLDFVFRARPGLFFVYWMALLLLVFAMVVVAVGDIFSTLAYARLSQVELRREREALEEAIRRYRAREGMTDNNDDPLDSKR